MRRRCRGRPETGCDQEGGCRYSRGDSERTTLRNVPLSFASGIECYAPPKSQPGIVLIALVISLTRADGNFISVFGTLTASVNRYSWQRAQWNHAECNPLRRHPWTAFCLPRKNHRRNFVCDPKLDGANFVLSFEIFIAIYSSFTNSFYKLFAFANGTGIYVVCRYGRAKLGKCQNTVKVVDTRYPPFRDHYLASILPQEGHALSLGVCFGAW